MRRIITTLASAALALGLIAAGTPAHALPWGDTTGQQTYVPGPTYLDDCGTAKDRILTGNTAKLTWYVYKNADGTHTATAVPKPGYWIDAEEYDADGNVIGGTEQTVYDFPAFSSGCQWITSIPAPTVSGHWPSVPTVPGIQWNAWKVTGGWSFVAVPKIGYGIPSGVQSKWTIPE